MRPERNPLDLNNLPDDYTRDGKQGVLEETSSSAGCRKKKSGAKDGKDEREKVYECRFCSLKFCKSQALGGHMNRHRQERETETLNRARQLVFSKDNLVAQGTAHHLSGQPVPHGCYRQTGNNGDPMLPFRSLYPARLISGTASSTLLPPSPPPPTQPYMYSSPFVSYPSHCPPHSINDYVVGHALPGSTSTHYAHAMPDTSYTCIGAPVRHPGNGGGPGSDVAASGGTGGTGGRDMSLHSQEEGGLSWGRSHAAGTQQSLDPSLINRFQDGF